MQTLRENKLREILKELLNTGIAGSFNPNEFGNVKLDQAESAIRELFEGAVPIPPKQVEYLNKGWTDCAKKTLESMRKL
jgi:hypothetical protein